MKLKILKVLEVKPDYTGTSQKTGKPYTIRSVYASVDVDGRQFETKVKTFSDDKLEDGAEFADVRVDEREYQGKKYTEYSVKTSAPAGGQGGGWKGGRAPMEKTAWADFMKRVDACWLKAAGMSSEHAATIFGDLLKNCWTVDVATIPVGLETKPKNPALPDPDAMPF